MKQLAVLLGLILTSSTVMAYQPVRNVPPPFPYHAPPAYPGQPYAYPRHGIPMPPPRYAHAPPYPMPWHPRPAVAAHPTAPAAGKAVDSPPEVKATPEPVLESAPKTSASATRTQREFLDMLLPIVERENVRLRVLRDEIEALLASLEQGHATDAKRKRLLGLARRYRVNGEVLSDADARHDLLSRVDTIPAALALAQAANESAWGTSRFAREGNNLFGIWTYDESKGIVPKGRPEGAKHLVRKFDSFDESVRYYLHTLNSHPAYQSLRDVRVKARHQGAQPTAMNLAGGLVKYSAKGELYVKLIRELINRYQLAALTAGNRNAG